MKLIDLHKQTAVVSNAATLNLGAAVGYYRTLAQAISAGEIAVGAKGLSIFVYNPANGAFQSALYTVTSATVLTLEKITSSSNAGAAVAFGGVACEVYSALPGYVASRAMSTRVVYTSSVCTSDSVLDMTPTTGANQTAALQSLLDLNADGSSLRVVFDGCYSVGAVSSTACLRVRSNTEIVALPGCGAVMLAEQPVPMWTNYNRTVVPANRVDKNITMRGGIWHGNRANQSIKETAALGGIFLLDFVGVDNLKFDGTESRKSKAFAFHATNVYNVDMDEYFVNYGADNSEVNTDGVHFNGPCAHINIRNLRAYGCADDALAFNADDGYGAGGQYGPTPYPRGPITDVTVDGMDLQGSWCGIRLLSGASRMDRFNIRNIKGKTGAYWLVVDNFNPEQTVDSGPGNIGSLSISDIDMENVYAAGWGEMQAHINCKVEQLTFNNVNKSKFLDRLFPALRFGPKADVGQAIISNFKSRSYNGGTYLTEQIHAVSGAKIGLLGIYNSDFHSDPSVSGSPIKIDAGATIDRLVAIGNSGKNFANLIANEGTVNYSHAPSTMNFMDAGVVVASTWALASGSVWQEDTSIPSQIINVGTHPGTVASAKKIAKDAFGGNVKVSSLVQFLGSAIGDALHSAINVRGTNTVPWGSGSLNCYTSDLHFEAAANNVLPSLQLSKTINGSQTALGTVNLTPNLADTYKMILNAKQTTISAFLQRTSDNFYLQPNATWSATANPAISVTDTSIAAVSAEVGLYSYSENTNPMSVKFTQFTVAAAD